MTLGDTLTVGEFVVVTVPVWLPEEQRDTPNRAVPVGEKDPRFGVMVGERVPEFESEPELVEEVVLVPLGVTECEGDQVELTVELI